MAVVRTQMVDLAVNGDGAQAFVARLDDDVARPGVVLIQEWWGLEPHIKDLAQRLAAEGFVTAVPDLYHGKIATEPDDAQKMAMTIRMGASVRWLPVEHCDPAAAGSGQQAPS